MTRLTIAIPSKGRLKDNAEAWLSKAGFKLKQAGGERGYTAELKGLPEADVMLLSAREIAQGLIDGTFHLGVTGEDLLNDLSPNLSADAQVIKRLEFGGADVVVAVPAAWLDVNTMSELEAAGALFRQRHGRRMKVATKYMRLTRNFFAQKSVGEYRLVESAGATEAAPSSGQAEVIVDITSTGATLKANGLKVLDDGVILKSQAALAGSLKAGWDEESLGGLQKLLASIEAHEAAQDKKFLLAANSIPDSLLKGEGVEAISATSILVPSYLAVETARKIADSGAGPVSITSSEFIFDQESPAFKGFVTNLTSAA
ncbi:ATP phosphoribosyltransferase [Henriciella pelagia]|jgi:ATP phosphoribosyltransferase|uniref:ATP phosphoribosyltransferase n=1 Tax=Henriciella pelagia TaxID=1977912 RepID=A0ABQ1IZJ3_9PROT|nr:ATP phosphoribosyltransferase [Henriciella pelagia]GGB56476.1 ATP phosphoribosyltransferase [Henriciella pelagia]